MADISDVQNAMVSAIAQLLYPNGIGLPSLTGVPTTVYGGWPQSAQLDADLAGFANGKGGKVHVTVFPNGTESNVTRYMSDWVPLGNTPATLTLAIAGQTVTLGGTVSLPQNVALLVDGLAYTYAVQAGDTLTTIATALAVQVPGATNAGAMITVASTSRIAAARAGGIGTAYRELRRQKKVVQVTIWADTPDHRNVTAAAIDGAFASLNFMNLPDGSAARMIYQSSITDDGTQRANLYRRDLKYSMEFATTQIADATEIVVAQENIQTGVTGVDVALSSRTTYQ